MKITHHNRLKNLGVFATKGHVSPRKGAIVTLETRKKQSEHNLAHPRRYWLGKKMSQELKTKISESKKGKTRVSPEHSYQNKLWHNNKRRIAKLGNGGSHTLGEWEHLKALYQWTCPSCWKKEPEITLSRDHITPISLGGMDDISNIQPLCRSCNSKKHTKTQRYA